MFCRYLSSVIACILVVRFKRLSSLFPRHILYNRFFVRYRYFNGLQCDVVLYYAQLFIGVTSLFSPEVSEEDVKTDDEDDEEEEDDIKSFPRSKSDWEAFRCILIFKNRFF